MGRGAISKKALFQPTLVWKSHSACINHTVRVEITLVRVEITVESIAFTFECVKIIMSVEATLCVYKSFCPC
jgi:hypothetical protein